jgi:PDZ domain-containing protein
VTDGPAEPSAPAPPASTAAPPPPPSFPPEGDAPARKRVSRWWYALLAVVVVLIAGVFAGFWVRLPYYTVSPGGEVPINRQIKVEGAKVYPPDGEVLLLFVRERARVNVWRYVQARLDPDIDLFPEREITQGGRFTPEDLKLQAQVAMANSQNAAKKVALEAIGYEVPLATQGVVVLTTVPGSPADGVLERNDVILSVDGAPIRNLDTLGERIRRLDPGDTVSLVIRRDGEERTVRVGTMRGDEGGTIIGVNVTQRYDFPVEIDIDTSDIGGPSAGLAMTLAIIDDLTPGDLTGGKTVAVTGTIATDATVGEIGGIEQKAVAARAADARLFIVPKCTERQLRAECLRDLRRARERAGDIPVVPVATLDEALRALRDAGGDPVKRVANAA